jgi:hypothetical protein
MPRPRIRRMLGIQMQIWARMPISERTLPISPCTHRLTSTQCTQVTIETERTVLNDERENDSGDDNEVDFVGYIRSAMESFGIDPDVWLEHQERLEADKKVTQSEN